MELIVATSNSHKLAEIRKMMPDSFKIRSLSEIDYHQPIEENGDTFEANALIKAHTVHKHTGLPVLADDSGIEVAALNGRPGLYSARYAGEGATDEDNNRKLLKELEGVTDRRARYKAVLAFVTKTGEFTFEGIVKGTIALSPIGNNGFGYDPLFIPEGYQNTFGELPPSVKHTISHRTIALGKFKDFLRQ